MKKGGSTRFSNHVMRETETGNWQKPSKKLRMSSVGGTTTSTKSLKLLPKKFLEDCHAVNHVYVPRRLRTGFTKRHKESVYPPSSCLINQIHKNEMPSEGCNKKRKVYADEQQHSTMLDSFAKQLTEDENEAIAGLLALAGINAGNNSTNEINLNKETSEIESSKSVDLVNQHMQIHDLNELRNTADVKKDLKDVTDGNESRKRCCSHVYICQIIKDQQIIEGKKVDSLKETNTDTTPENITNCSIGVISNAARTNCVPQPYFGNPFCDPSQWSRPMFPNQKMLMNSFIPGAREMMIPHSGSCVPASMLDVLGSNQQLGYKMQIGQHSSGYDQNGGLLRVDNSLTLKLTLQ